MIRTLLFLCFSFLLTSGIFAQISVSAVTDFVFDQQMGYSNPAVPANEYNTTYVDDEDVVKMEDLERLYPAPKDHFYDFRLHEGDFLQPVIWDDKGNPCPFRIEEGVLRYRVPDGEGFKEKTIKRKG